MMKRAIAAAAALTAAAGCAPADRAEQRQAAPPAAAVAAGPAAAADAAPGRRLVEAKCFTCHGPDIALAGPRSAAQWNEVIEVMIGHGMVVTNDERRIIHDYLAAVHGPAAR